MDRRSFMYGLLPALAAARAGGAEPRLRLSHAREDGSWRVEAAGREVLGYRHAAVQGPPGTGPLYTRAGYIHPVHAPGGALLTDDFPPDHLHQRGLFFAWTKTACSLGGVSLQPDFWNLGAGTGRVRSLTAEPREEDGGAVLLEARHCWEARVGEEWVPVLDETWRVTVQPPAFADPKAPDAAYVFDLASSQTPRVTLELPQYRYGGVSIRCARSWRQSRPECVVLTSEGKDWAGAEGSRARWVDMSGPLEQGEAGIALLDHPENPGAPTMLRVPPERPYYIFSAPKAAPVTLEAGRTYRFRYRVVAHNGRPDAGRLDAAWRAFAAAKR